MNVGAFLSRSAALYPDKRALSFEGRGWTYRELDDRVNALATGLEVICGAAAGDRVLLWMYNGPEFIEALFACWKLGLVAVPVNVRLLPGEVAFHAEDCGAKAMIHGAEMAAEASAIPVRHWIGVRAEAELDYDEVLARGDGAKDRTTELPDNAPAWLFYTSGTTGRPKGATLTHGNLSFVVVGWCADLHRVTPDDVVLHCAPLSHGAGFQALTSVARGADNLIHARYDPQRVLESIANERVTATWMVPTQIRLLLDTPGLDDRNLSSLTHIVYGGSPIHLEDLIEAVERLGPVLCQLYGQGESPMTISWLSRREHRPDRPDREVLTSAGVTRTGMEVRIVGEGLDPLPAGATGEIVVRGPAVMSGYWERPEANAEVLQEGFLRTGDLGRFDERGYLYVLDRMKDLIISGGSNVYAREVEDVLVTHPEVHEAAVFGIRHRIWGEAVTAAVVCEGRLSEGDLIAYCRQRMADYKSPKRVHVVERLPKSAYGKVLKRQLREQFASRVDDRSDR